MKNELESLIEEIKEILKEIRKDQINEINLSDQRHKLYMKNLSKLEEYNKILDMTNQVFEKRLLSIEKSLERMKNNKTWKKRKLLTLLYFYTKENRKKAKNNKLK